MSPFRFGYTNTASRQTQPPQEVTGSVAPRSAPVSRVDSQPLPSPSAPATVASNGVANGAQGLGAYRPSAPIRSDVTGSVATRTPAAPPPPKPDASPAA